MTQIWLPRLTSDFLKRPDRSWCSLSGQDWLDNVAIDATLRARALYRQDLVEIDSTGCDWRNFGFEFFLKATRPLGRDWLDRLRLTQRLGLAESAFSTMSLCEILFDLKNDLCDRGDLDLPGLIRLEDWKSVSLSFGSSLLTRGDQESSQCASGYPQRQDQVGEGLNQLTLSLSGRSVQVRLRNTQGP